MSEAADDGEDEDDAAAERRRGGARGRGRRTSATQRARAPRPGRAAPSRSASSSKTPRGTLTPEKRLALRGRRRSQGAPARRARRPARRVVPGALGRHAQGRPAPSTPAPDSRCPTVQRTLRPLAYDPPAEADGAPDLDAPPSAWTPKAPEEILASRSATRPAAPAPSRSRRCASSPRRCTPSLHHHGRVSADGERSVVAARSRSPSRQAAAASERLGQELLPCRPDDAALRAAAQGRAAPPRRRALHLRRRPRPAGCRAVPAGALDRDHGPHAARSRSSTTR